MDGSRTEGSAGALYQQGKRAVLTKNLPRYIGFSLIVIGAIGATAAMLRDFQSDPSTPRLYYLLLVVVWSAFLEAVLVAGSSLSRSRFVVWQDAFVPPFRWTRVLARKLPSIVRFDNVGRMVPAVQTIRGSELLYGVSVELVSGERLLVLAGDVGTLGVRTLLESWKAWKSSPSSSAPSVGVSEVPPWIGREWREELAIGVVLLVILTMSALVLFGAGDPASAGGIALTSLAILGSAFAVGWLYSAWVRRRRTEGLYGNRPRSGS